MNNQELRKNAQRFTNGSDFMGITEFMRWQNCGRSTANRKLKGLEKVPGTKKFFIPEIIKHLQALEYEEGRLS